ncbi:MAG: polysaccharide biosynthesis/export family protein [Fimbriimonas sp.]
MASSQEAYRLQQEDVLRIQVFNQTQILSETPVGRDGTVTAPFVGSVPAEGRTLTELEASLVKLYKEKLKLRDPIVSVVIVRYRELRASVIGAVNRPAVYTVRAGDTLLSLLSQGGGIIEGRADARRVRLRRKDSAESIPIDLFTMLNLGDTSQNYEVQDGDELTIPDDESRNRIVILGAVNRPGAYAFREPMRLADAVALAGGEIRYRSRFSKVLVLREIPGQAGQYQRIVVDFTKFVKKFDSGGNLELKARDLIYVPESNTPDFGQISALSNVAFIFDRLGGSFLGIRLFR